MTEKEFLSRRLSSISELPEERTFIRDLDVLLRSGRNVWFSIPSTDMWHTIFLQDALSVGMHFSSGEALTPDTRVGLVMAVHADYTIAYTNATIMYLTKTDRVLYVDYSRWKMGDADYILN